MKSFLQFISEAETQASTQAKNMGLSGDGHGDWYDKQGKLVAKTVSGRLKFFGNRALGKKIEPQVLAKPKTETPKPEKSKEKKQLTVGFGRFNPPTIGHEKLMNSISKTAGKGGEYKIYPSRSQDSTKNPLNPTDKVEYMRKAFPDHAKSIVDDDKTRTIFDVLKSAYGKGYSTVNVVVGSDRVKEFENLANKYNGQLYNFDKINVVSAGERSADSKGVEGMSASKLRKAAMDGDFKTFRSGISKALDDKSAKNLFNTVQKSMKKVKSEAWEFAPKLAFEGLRENYIAKKIFRIGDMVENINYGLIGKITRAGANYVIAVTEDNIMFKSWLKDLNEYTEVHMKSRMRDKIHPNTLVGTDGYRDNLINMTPGQYPLINKIRQSLKKSG
tara:strand:+ start:197 stop:1357 length:1161 start_codon:yes stop_codon:yes gene_type:complete